MAQNAKRIRLSNPDLFRERSRAYYKENKDSRKKSLAKWRAKNKPHLSDYQTKWRADNRNLVNLYSRLHGSIRRSRLATTITFEITTKDLQRILNKPCVYCGQPATHVDHVIPISRGGTNGIGNLIGACSSCNLSKSDKFVMEWRIWKARLSGLPL